MTDGWRHRFLAPVYALAISFALVFILGAALNNGQNNGQNNGLNGLMRIRFVVEGSSESAEFPDLAVWVRNAEDKSQLAYVHQYDGAPQFALPIQDKGIQICTILPDGWFSADAKVADSVSCWSPPVRSEDVVITLARQKD